MKRIIFASLFLLGFLAPQARATDTVYYIHTDALGSPVAMTDANRNVVERTQYGPYGEVLNRPEHDGPGYTGHEEDAATGLTNMQQRYDDKVIGRFLSMDPVQPDGTTGASFNRYAYANNNPYRFTDPDGRVIESANSNNNKKLEKMINSLAVGTFKFDKNNKLHLVKASGRNDKYSKYYAKKLVGAINSKYTIKIDISDNYKDLRSGENHAVRGGLTQGVAGGKADQNVVITGRSYTLGISDTHGNPLTETPNFILGHELVGHAIPAILGPDTGNAVQDENKIRAQIPGAPLRQAEPGHAE
jgi:RHS repeat-associated protein